MSDRRKDYLWEGTGDPDPEVQALEDLLGQFGHDEGEATGDLIDRAARPRLSRRPGTATLLVAAAAVVAAWFFWGGLSAPADGLSVMVADSSRQIRVGEWFHATAAQNKLVLGVDTGTFTLDPGSALQILQVDEERTRFYLRQGRLLAKVKAEVQDRFFQVVTPSATCVDLGCEYELTVSATGVARVIVTFGAVAFEVEGRDVYIPSGASCRASKTHGVDTPRFVDASPDLVLAIDAFDAGLAAPAAERFALAEAVCAAAGYLGTLSVWHLLQDRDPTIAELAEAALIEIAGVPEGLPGTGALQFEPETWKEHLDLSCW